MSAAQDLIIHIRIAVVFKALYSTIQLNYGLRVGNSKCGKMFEKRSTKMVVFFSKVDMPRVFILERLKNEDV